ncbi:unnamed protein product, partial [marine sediment metagenome]
MVKKLLKEIKNRDNNYNRALRVSRMNREPLHIEPKQYGTDNAKWVRELRRLKMRERRKPQRVEELRTSQARKTPMFKQIQRRPSKKRQQDRARQFIYGLRVARDRNA